MSVGPLFLWFFVGGGTTAAFGFLAMAWPALTRKRARTYPKKERPIRSRPVTPIKKKPSVRSKS